MPPWKGWAETISYKLEKKYYLTKTGVLEVCYKKGGKLTELWTANWDVIVTSERAILSVNFECKLLGEELSKRWECYRATL